MSEVTKCTCGAYSAAACICGEGFDPTTTAAGQPSADLAVEIAYGGGRSENVQVPARCLREVVVTSDTACDPAWLDAISVLCLRPLPCDNPHHKPERPTYGTR